MEHRDKIYKQCPNLYKDFVKEHKHEWPSIVFGDEENYPIHEDFRNLRQNLQGLLTKNKLLELSEEFANIQK